MKTTKKNVFLICLLISIGYWLHAISEDDPIEPLDKNALSNVKHIKTDGNFTLNLICSDSVDIVINGTKKNLKRVDSQIKKNVLIITYNNPEKIKLKSDPEFVIDLRINQIASILNEGNLTLQNENGFRGDKLILVNRGKATMNLIKLNYDEINLYNQGQINITLQGKTNILKIKQEGKGLITALDLPAHDAYVFNDGISDIIVNADTFLQVNQQGNGSVQYLGKPQIEKEIDGFGTVSEYE